MWAITEESRCKTVNCLSVGRSSKPVSCLKLRFGGWPLGISFYTICRYSVTKPQWSVKHPHIPPWSFWDDYSTYCKSHEMYSSLCCASLWFTKTEMSFWRNFYHRIAPEVVKMTNDNFQGWGLLNLFSAFSYFPFFRIIKLLVTGMTSRSYSNVSVQPSCGDTWQIWTWFTVSNLLFCWMKFSHNVEIIEWSFTPPPPPQCSHWWKLTLLFRCCIL